LDKLLIADLNHGCEIKERREARPNLATAVGVNAEHELVNLGAGQVLPLRRWVSGYLGAHGAGAHQLGEPGGQLLPRERAAAVRVKGAEGDLQILVGGGHLSGIAVRRGAKKSGWGEKPGPERERGS
jgi:hypothetical protein